MQNNGYSPQYLRLIAEDVGLSADELVGYKKAPKQRKRGALMVRIKTAFGRKQTEFAGCRVMADSE